ncbi:MAG: thiol reductant ABC exporter subunit CydD, partial [Anaerolinea sp.]|nr:thiol reductant ABC exporter subunit CydD [Anaerolinea sp.]
MDRRLLAEARTVRREFALSIALQTAAGMCLIGQAYAFSRAVAGVFLGGEPLDGMLLAQIAVFALLRAALMWAGN